MNKILFSNLLALSVLSGGCASPVFDKLNPLAEEPPVTLGEPNSNALISEMSGSGTSEAALARHSLEVMGQYRQAQAPEPTYPVVQPAEVRLMWVPDHLSKTGDLVPAHYYYLKVLPDRWAVQDAFDLEQQLNQGSSSGSSATPWSFEGK